MKRSQNKCADFVRTYEKCGLGHKRGFYFTTDRPESARARVPLST